MVSLLQLLHIYVIVLVLVLLIHWPFSSLLRYFNIGEKYINIRNFLILTIINFATSFIPALGDFWFFALSLSIAFFIGLIYTIFKRDFKKKFFEAYLLVTIAQLFLLSAHYMNLFV